MDLNNSLVQGYEGVPFRDKKFESKQQFANDPISGACAGLVKEAEKNKENAPPNLNGHKISEIPDQNSVAKAKELFSENFDTENKISRPPTAEEQLAINIATQKKLIEKIIDIVFNGNAGELKEHFHNMKEMGLSPKEQANATFEGMPVLQLAILQASTGPDRSDVQTDKIKVLLENGADPNRVVGDVNALQFAEAMDNSKIIEMLLEAGGKEEVVAPHMKEAADSKAPVAAKHTTSAHANFKATTSAKQTSGLTENDIKKAVNIAIFATAVIAIMVTPDKDQIADIQNVAYKSLDNLESLQSRKEAVNGMSKGKKVNPSALQLLSKDPKMGKSKLTPIVLKNGADISEPLKKSGENTLQRALREARQDPPDTTLLEDILDDAELNTLSNKDLNALHDFVNSSKSASSLHKYQKKVETEFNRRIS